MQQYFTSAVALLKAFLIGAFSSLDLERVMTSYMRAKAFPAKVMHKLFQQGGAALFFALVLRRRDFSGRVGTEAVLQYVLRRIKDTASRVADELVYQGAPAQNLVIDQALAASNVGRDLGRFGQGAASNMQFPERIELSFSNVPVAIIGYGAAGLLVDSALRHFGFRPDVYEKRREVGGIWSQANVSGGTRNNPFDLTFGRLQLPAAPGGGAEVAQFLNELAKNRRDRGFSTIEATVRRVEPGVLGHTLHFQEGKPKSYPIVINAIGLGTPKSVSDDRRMTTSSTNGAQRWQKQLTAKEVEGKQYVFIGLGNSTAEMLTQMHYFMDQGVDCDYRVLTHYPEEAVRNPNSTVTTERGTFRVFRDLSVPNLVDYQGDLPQARADYFRALHEGKIIADVRRWEKEGETMMVYHGQRGTITLKVKCDALFTLIGYGHDQGVYEAMGLRYSSQDRCGHFDYDGEVIRVPGEADAEKRLAKGYYGFGAILDSPHDRNAIVLPGMLHRLGDLVFGVIIRALEYQAQQPAKSP